MGRDPDEHDDEKGGLEEGVRCRGDVRPAESVVSHACHAG